MPKFSEGFLFSIAGLFSTLREDVVNKKSHLRNENRLEDNFLLLFKRRSDKIKRKQLWARQFIIYSTMILCKFYKRYSTMGILYNNDNKLKLFHPGNVFEQFYYLFIAQCLQPKKNHRTNSE